MNRILKLVLVPMAFALALGAATPASAGEAQDYLKGRQEDLVKVLRDPATPARSAKVAAMLDGMFDYDKLARDSLGKHAEGRTPEEMAEFTDVLKKLVRKAYQKNIEKTLNYTITWVGEEGGGDTAVIKTTAQSTKPGTNQEVISIDYKLHKRDGKWAIGDVVTEQSSLVNTYRNQFNKTINSANAKGENGWTTLIAKLKTKANRGG